MKMSLKLGCRRSAEILCLMLALVMAPGCNQSPKQLSAQEEKDLQELREANKEVQKLRASNRELDRLRKDNEELKTLRNSAAEIARLRTDNDQLRKQLAAIPAAAQREAPAPANVAPEPPAPLTNIPQAFEDAALLLASQGEPKPEDVPHEGDQILIDHTVIGILIPEFAKLTNSQQFEVSGWLKSKGVAMRNYQQLTTLGITNFQIRRAPPVEAQPPK